MLCGTAIVCVLSTSAYYNSHIKASHMYIYHENITVAVTDTPQGGIAGVSMQKQKQKVLPEVYKALAVKSAQLLHEAVKTLTGVLDEGKIPYFMTFGTLLGSFRHHGRIPWDDDFDIAAKISDEPRIAELFLNVSDLSRSNRGVFWKIYPVAGAKIRGYPYKFPSVDIFWFKMDNATHLSLLRYPHTLFKVSDIFPTYRRPFNSLMLPAPCNTSLVLAKAIDNPSRCVSNYWNHMAEKYRPQSEILSVPCNQLHSLYPFVSRSSDNDDTVTESLVFNDTVLNRWTYKRLQC